MNRLSTLTVDATTNGHVVSEPSANGSAQGTFEWCQEGTPSTNPYDGETRQVESRKVFASNGFRDKKGRFVRGNPGGPGNPFSRQVAGFRRAVCRAVSQRDLEKLAQALLKRAMHGELAAGALLLAYTIGKPGVAADPDTLDHAEWRGLKESAVSPADLLFLMHHLRARDLCDIARGAWPGMATKMLGTFADALRNPAPPAAIEGLETSKALAPSEQPPHGATVTTP